MVGVSQGPDEAGVHARVEPRRTARPFLLDLVSNIERKTRWQLAEHAGHPAPERMQRLLREAAWDAQAVADDVRDLVAEHLGHQDGVLIADRPSRPGTGVTSITLSAPALSMPESFPTTCTRR